MIFSTVGKPTSIFPAAWLVYSTHRGAYGESTVRWPADAIDATSTDLGGPLRSLLEDLNLLETQQDQHDGVQALSTTPWSLQVITAGSLQISKVTATLVGGLGGATAVWAAIKGFWISQHDPDRLAYIGAAAVIVSVLAVSLAIIVGQM